MTNLELAVKRIAEQRHEAARGPEVVTVEKLRRAGFEPVSFGQTGGQSVEIWGNPEFRDAQAVVLRRHIGRVGRRDGRLRRVLSAMVRWHFGAGRAVAR